ncbi:unnamed protein product [Rotaria sordida]|uniref:N-alpha-acetyltransferase 60 n=1 Tax=Rotaria sordida TaxID=392033 RepID=A0A813SU96_9BILA|nr:unnamed protein product [Rotaria sordida]
MNVIDNVRRAFRSKYSFDIQSTWLQPCLAWLRDQFQITELTNNYTLEKIYTQWLHTDIALIADACCLPNDLDLNAKKIQLSGKYALQINSILCISESYYSQVLDIHGDQNENERIDTDITETQQWKPPPTKRALYLELTDGKTILRGLEYETISGLDRDSTLPGAKILVTGPILFRRGMLLLTPKNTKILGGYVESLLDKNTSIETALTSLSKTASKLDESRMRFNRLNIKVHPPIVSNDSTNRITDRQTNQDNFHDDEDEMDEFIRQAYADGMLNDDSHVAPESIDYNPPPPSSYNTIQPSTTTTNRIPTPIDQPEEVILISDDDDDNYLLQTNIPPTESSLSDNQISDVSSFAPPSSPPPPPVRPSIPKVSLPYTYLSLIRHQISQSNRNYQDFIIKGCFSSLVKNPRVIKNEFDLLAYVNDGSDCLLVRLASDLLAHRIGITVLELIIKRKECKNDIDKQKFQTDFNERLKKFGHNDDRRIIIVFEDNIKLSLAKKNTIENQFVDNQYFYYRMQTSLLSLQSITVNLDSPYKISTEQLHVLQTSNISISFRFLRPGDQSEVKSLCCDWFPIEYPDLWYDDIVHDTRYFALAACEKNTQRIVGLVVADILPLGSCNREDQQILHKSFPLTTPVCYILILGVEKEYRRQGLAGILLQQLLNTLYERATCKAVYLHVLYSNRQAIKFYQSKQFQYRVHLPHYYCIKGDNFDGYCFALYINGGHPPFTLSDFFSNWWTYLTGTSPCRLLQTLGHFVANRFIFTDNHQRTSSYKQISRII